MFKIDLLKGQGIPVKSTPAGLAIAAAISTVPVIVLIVVVGCFMVNSVNIANAEKGITRFTNMKEELSEKVSSLNTIEQEKKKISSSLDEVSSSFYRHTQWTNILMTVSENMPDSMVLSEFQVKQKPLSKQVPKNNNPEEQVFITIPVRTLRMRVSGNSAYDCGAPRLTTSNLSGAILKVWRLNDFWIVSFFPILPLGVIGLVWDIC